MTVTMGRPAKISSLSRLCGILSGTALMAGHSWNERTHARRLCVDFSLCHYLAHAASRVALCFAGGFNFAAFGVPL